MPDIHKEKKSNIHWHPAFIEAMRAELKPYLDKIEILSELPLTTEPLKIDCIIIKKSKDLVIKKNFALIFRDWNIMEYKSPEDHVSINDFHKVYAYACLYAVIQNVPISSITISFVESRYPRKLIGFLRKVRKFTVEKTSPGIYTIQGDVFGIQIIDSRYLPGEESLWLKSLRGNLKVEIIDKVITEIKKQGKTVSMEAYWEVIGRANAGLLREVQGMRAPSLKQILFDNEVGAGWIAEWKSQAETEGRAEVARNLKASGMSCDLISQYTGLPLTKIKKL